jgi:soluble lytic murein transglycosylase-like protein
MSLLLASIILYSSQTGVPVGIARGLMMSESGGDVTAVSRTGDLGAWQLNPRYHDYFRWRFNAGWEFEEVNVEASTRISLRYLASLHRQFGTWTRALEAYKCGPSKSAPEHIVLLCRQIVREGLK